MKERKLIPGSPKENQEYIKFLGLRLLETANRRNMAAKDAQTWGRLNQEVNALQELKDDAEEQLGK